MTHDELLAKIDEELATDYEDSCGNVPLSLNALRAVAVLHTPVLEKLDDPFVVKFCHKCKQIYPCETIEAIEKELK